MEQEVVARHGLMPHLDTPYLRHEAMPRYLFS